MVQRLPLRNEGHFCVNVLVMITVYYLKSTLDAATYIDMAKDVIARLKEHNAGKNRYTKGHIPWEILYTETHPDWATARLREKYFKTAAGKKWLQNKLKKWRNNDGSLPDCVTQAGIPVHGTRLNETPLKFERRFCFFDNTSSFYLYLLSIYCCYKMLGIYFKTKIF
jgi:putative endonuclease